MAENELELAHEEEGRIQELLSCLEAKLREYPDLLWGSSAGELRYVFEEVEGQEGYVCFVTFCPLL